MKQSNPNVYLISQDAKLDLFERLKQEIASKVIDDVAKNRKRKRGKTTNGGSGVGVGDGGDDDAQEGMASASAAADGVSDSSPSSESVAKCIVRSRLIVGINQCTRILEEAYLQQQHRQQPQHQQIQIESKTTSVITTNATKAHHPKPTLLLLSKDVLRPPSSILDHITIYSRHLNVPTLVLPGRASSELGQALGMKCAAVALILSSSSMREDLSRALDGNNNDSLEDVEKTKQREEEWKETNQDIDSFVSYAINKVPKM